MKISGGETKKEAILEVARELGAERFSPAEVEQIRRQLVVKLGPSGKTAPEYIAEVLEDAGLRVVWSTEADTQGLYEEEFRDLLHFATLEEAEMCLVRLDELLRKFQAGGEAAAAERVMEVARLGRRRAEMIARNPRVEPRKREEKQEILQWFRIWLDTPEAFFDWLDVRKQSADYERRFGSNAAKETEDNS
ncbi:MAG TPA: hypothetical protein VGG55_05555 [Candidatus Acidoferrales bacterium]|jgi:hypothetical protein